MNEDFFPMAYLIFNVIAFLLFNFVLFEWINNVMNYLFLAGAATIYARYKFVQKLGEATQLVSPRLNKAALAVGMLSCLGMCVVATFQVSVFTPVGCLIGLKIPEFLFFFFFLFDFRKQRYQKFTLQGPCCSLWPASLTSSSSPLYHTMPFRLAPPSVCAECVWASPSSLLWHFCPVSFHFTPPTLQRICSLCFPAHNRLSLIDDSAVICGGLVKQNSLHEDPAGKVRQTCFFLNDICR